MSSRKKALLIDDDEIVQKLISKLCERHGADIKVASTLKEINEVLGGEAVLYDLFFIDLILPETSGWEILRKMRENEALRSKPAVVLTGAVLSDEEKEKILEKADFIIEKKNFSVSVFDEVLTKWL